MAHKSYHTLNLFLEDNTPVGVIFGMLRQLVAINEQFNPDKIIVAWDGGSTRRKKIFPEYKANRINIQNGFHQQLLIIQHILYDLGLEQILVPGEEADDIIGSFCENNKKENKIIIVSNDHDLLQLVDDNIWMYSHSMKNSKLYTKDSIKAQYGLEPNQLVDIYILKGDLTDNVDGIKGIGMKKAQKLVQEYGNVNNIIKASQESNSLDLISSNTGKILRNRDLLTVRTNIPYSVQKGVANLILLKELFKEYFKFQYFLDHWGMIEKLSKNNA
jgi:DNA polymerase-1